MIVEAVMVAVSLHLILKIEATLSKRHSSA